MEMEHFIQTRTRVGRTSRQVENTRSVATKIERIANLVEVTGAPAAAKNTRSTSVIRVTEIISSLLPASQHGLHSPLAARGDGALVSADTIC
ncbi:hypothetical protein BIW11_10103 [Tropilaelaps mercedesae]|uniref:Uncharacterized protein n=1 Tax=Tropilaelaps mercedesae TaxID=418985 RepID=A0A1V9XHL4_9ACAR|nr:hypothetical protein BIW11_10103 [Tropilaelaps mercedesae]